MKVTYLPTQPCLSGQFLAIADIPDGVEFLLYTVGGYDLDNRFLYRKEGSVLHFVKNPAVKSDVKGDSNSDWLSRTTVVERYKGLIV